MSPLKYVQICGDNKMYCNARQTSHIMMSCLNVFKYVAIILDDEVNKSTPDYYVRYGRQYNVLVV